MSNLVIYVYPRPLPAPAPTPTTSTRESRPRHLDILSSRKDETKTFTTVALGHWGGVLMFLFCFVGFFWRLLSMHVHIYITQTAESNAVSFLPKFGLSLCREIEGASSLALEKRGLRERDCSRILLI